MDPQKETYRSAIFATGATGAGIAMASGVPVIISNNTGHVDIVDEAHCFPLKQQMIDDSNGAESGWGESSAEEIVSLLEFVRENPGMARDRATAASKFIHKHYTWPKAVAHMSQLFVKAGLTSAVETEDVQFIQDDGESVTE